MTASRGGRPRTLAARARKPATSVLSPMSLPPSHQNVLTDPVRFAISGLPVAGGGDGGLVRHGDVARSRSPRAVVQAPRPVHRAGRRALRMSGECRPRAAPHSGTVATGSAAPDGQAGPAFREASPGLLTGTRGEAVEYAPDLTLEFGKRLTVRLEVAAERIVDRAPARLTGRERRQQVRPPFPA